VLRGLSLTITTILLALCMSATDVRAQITSNSITVDDKDGFLTTKKGLYTVDVTNGKTFGVLYFPPSAGHASSNFTFEAFYGDGTPFPGVFWDLGFFFNDVPKVGHYEWKTVKNTRVGANPFSMIFHNGPGEFCSSALAGSYDFTTVTFSSDKQRITQLAGKFSIQCTATGGRAAGLLSFDETLPLGPKAPSDGSGGGGSTGGGTGDTGGTGGTGDSGGGTSVGGPTNPPPANAPVVTVPEEVRSDTLLLNNLQSTKVPLAVSTVVDGDVQLDAFSEPEGLAVSLSPAAIASPGNGSTTLTIATGETTRAQDYNVIISALSNELQSFAVVHVSVLCDPPVIFGIDQPRNATINKNSAATLEVKSGGSAPFAYQWYSGATGITSSPISGATHATFNTGKLSSSSDYWVRVTNPCGSVDSNTATVTVH
jgi:hypothetical protein